MKICDERHQRLDSYSVPNFNDLRNYIASAEFGWMEVRNGKPIWKLDKKFDLVSFNF